MRVAALVATSNRVVSGRLEKVEWLADLFSRMASGEGGAGGGVPVRDAAAGAGSGCRVSLASLLGLVEGAVVGHEDSFRVEGGRGAGVGMARYRPDT